MTKALQSIVRWFRLLFVVVVPSTPATPTVMPRPKVSRESYGSLYFREDLLERLPEYMEHLRQMKKTDPDAWATYRRLGGSIATHQGITSEGGLDVSWRKFRPGFGLLYISMTELKKEDADNIDAVMIYYLACKYPRNRRIQAIPRKSTLYEVSLGLMWDDKPLLVSGFIAVDREGNMTPLKELGEQGHWDYPSWSYMYVERHREKKIKSGWKTPEEVLIGAFTFVANRTIWAMSGGIQVRAYKDGVTAQFNIHTERTPYFFDDRVKEKNEAGSTKRIFHIVRTHRRANGSLVPVHYRGLKRFEWNGYRVSITVPGKDHAPLQEFDVTARVDDSADPVPPGWMLIGDAAKLIGRHMDKAA